MFMSEKERMEHPQLHVIPGKYWLDHALFNNQVPFWFINLMKKDADLTLELQKITINILPEQQKRCLWLAIVFSHPELNDDELWAFAEQWAISGELRFKVAVTSDRIKLLNMAVTHYLKPDRKIGLWEQITTAYSGSSDKLQEVLLDANFTVFYDATSRGYFKMVTRLLELVAASQINVKYMIESSFYSIFRVAVQNGHLAVVHLLVSQKDMDVADMLKAVDTYGAYRLAQDKKHQPVIAFLDTLALIHQVTIKNRNPVYSTATNNGFFSDALRLSLSDTSMAPSMLIN